MCQSKIHPNRRVWQPSPPEWRLWAPDSSQAKLFLGKQLIAKLQSQSFFIMKFTSQKKQEHVSHCNSASSCTEVNSFVLPTQATKTIEQKTQTKSSSEGGWIGLQMCSTSLTASNTSQPLGRKIWMSPCFDHRIRIGMIPLLDRCFQY